MRREVIQATIASGASLSGAINIDRGELVGIQMPAGWDAADITFAAVINDGVTFGKMVDDAHVEVKITTPAATEYVAIRGYAGVAVRGPGTFKIRSGIAGLPVNQTALRVLGIVVLVADEG